jgi:hypothetical protein
MKRTLLILLLVTCHLLSAGQTLTQNVNNRLLNKKELSGDSINLPLKDYDFSSLFTSTDNSVIYGFIGDNYQRIRIKFITVTKSKSSPDVYLVYGKSMVKNNICEFRGTINISDIRKYKKMSYGTDDEYKNKGIKGQYVILGTYNFEENKAQTHSGIFKGAFQSNFYLDKNNKVHYDNIDLDSDGYTNNQFVGTWTAYNSALTKKCNWADFRVPESGDLDIGAGEFSPAGKYLKYGWLNVSEEQSLSYQPNKWWK